MMPAQWRRLRKISVLVTEGIKRLKGESAVHRNESIALSAR